jgi:hypothetical protein
MDYQCKLSPEAEIVYVASDGLIIQMPTTIVGQVQAKRSIQTNTITVSTTNE